jgi:hypothetical protein
MVHKDPLDPLVLPELQVPLGSPAQQGQPVLKDPREFKRLLALRVHKGLLVHKVLKVSKELLVLQVHKGLLD